MKVFLEKTKGFKKICVNSLISRVGRHLVAYQLKMIKSHSSLNSLRIVESQCRESGYGNSAFKGGMPDKK